MKSIILILLVMTIGVSQQQSLSPRCLLSRQDYLPCHYRNTPLRNASDNQYIIHATKLGTVTKTGQAKCRIKRGKDYVNNITTLGTENTKIIYSPGFITQKKYSTKMLVEYNIDCGKNRFAYLNLTTMDMRGKTCNDSGKFRCQDYVNVTNRGSYNEFCGSATFREPLVLTDKIVVSFRTSEEEPIREDNSTHYTGFEMYIICFDHETKPHEGCLTPENFSSLCGSRLHPSGMRRKRSCETPPYTPSNTYAEVFPGYPSHLRMREDVAKFHALWQSLKIYGARCVMRAVSFAESVFYNNRVIRILDVYDTEIERHEDVILLRTLDGEGRITTYIHGVNSQNYPHFPGPGQLVIVGRLAFLQLFTFDPRGLLPTPEEQEQLAKINDILLTIPESYDYVPSDKIDPFEDEFSGSGFVELVGSGFYKDKRSVTDDPGWNSHSTGRVWRRSPGDCNNETLILALRNREACNPVLRQQAVSLLNTLDKRLVAECQNFTIDCNVRGKRRIKCESSDHLLVQRFMINGINYLKCDPFLHACEWDEDVKNVTVEAINCNGQKGTFHQTVTP